MLEMEVVAHDAQDLAQHLVQVEGREYRLAGIVKEGDFLHAARLSSQENTARLPRVPFLPGQFSTLAPKRARVRK